MIEHTSDEILNDYVDGLLTERAVGEVELHLSACGACRTAVAELRGLVRDASSLAGVMPTRDLLPQIRARATAERRTWTTWIPLAAALALTAGLSVVVFGVQMRPRTAADEISRNLQTDLGELELDDSRLSPSSMAAFEEGARSIDRAIAEIRGSQETDSIDADSILLLSGLYHKKLQLFLRASKFSS